jgi:N-methylhydantoinase B
VINRPTGVRGGGPSLGPEAWRVGRDGGWEQYHHVVGEVVLEPDESIVSLSAGGGGYGPALDRDPAAVLIDVIDDYVSLERAEGVYGVVIQGDPDRWETLAVDEAATAERRSELAFAGPPARTADDQARAAREEPDWWVAR